MFIAAHLEEHRWRSGESTRLPILWHDMSQVFVGSRLCIVGFSPGCPVPPPLPTYHAIKASTQLFPSDSDMETLVTLVSCVIL